METTLIHDQSRQTNNNYLFILYLLLGREYENLERFPSNPHLTLIFAMRKYPPTATINRDLFSRIETLIRYGVRFIALVH